MEAQRRRHLRSDRATYLHASASAGTTLTVTVTGTKAGYTTTAKTSDSRYHCRPSRSLRRRYRRSRAPRGSVRPSLRIPEPGGLPRPWLISGSATASPFPERPAAPTPGFGQHRHDPHGDRHRDQGRLHHHRENQRQPLSLPTIAVTTTPAPTITGTPGVGSTLTASPGTWGPAVALAYQWKPTASPSPERPVAPTAGFGRRSTSITVTVTGTKAGYTSITKSSTATAAIAAPTLTPAPVPTITGTSRVGSTLTASPGTWGPPQWPWRTSGTLRRRHHRSDRWHLQAHQQPTQARPCPSPSPGPKPATPRSRNPPPRRPQSPRHPCLGPGSDDHGNIEGRYDAHGQPRHRGPGPSDPGVPVVPLRRRHHRSNRWHLQAHSATQARPCPSRITGTKAGYTTSTRASASTLQIAR